MKTFGVYWLNFLPAFFLYVCVDHIPVGLVRTSDRSQIQHDLTAQTSRKSLVPT